MWARRACFGGSNNNSREVFPIGRPRADERLESKRTFVVNGVTLEIGTGFLKAGSRMPDQGESRHPKREITLILEGEISTTSGNRTRFLGTGDIVTIPPGQEQHTVVHRDTRLLWMFFGT